VISDDPNNIAYQIKSDALYSLAIAWLYPNQVVIKNQLDLKQNTIANVTGTGASGNAFSTKRKFANLHLGFFWDSCQIKG
jgi:hypothetical protein